MFGIILDVLVITANVALIAVIVGRWREE